MRLRLGTKVRTAFDKRLTEPADPCCVAAQEFIMARMSRMSMSLHETLVADVRQVLRQMQKRPAFAGLVILVLGTGFAVSTAMFSTIRTVLLNPLPYRSPER